MWRTPRNFPIFRSVAAILAVFSLSPFSALYSAQNSALTLDGTPADPFQKSPGKVIVLVFVRTDCPISNRYAPAIQRINAKYKAKAAFWLVYPDKSESAEKIRQHEREYSYKLPALRDPQRGRARNAPTTHELEDAIRAALNGNAPPASTPGVGCFISDLE